MAANFLRWYERIVAQRDYVRLLEEELDRISLSANLQNLFFGRKRRRHLRRLIAQEKEKLYAMLDEATNVNLIYERVKN